MNAQPIESNRRSGLLVGGVLAAAALAAGLVVFGSLACSGERLRQGLAGDAATNPDTLLAELKGDKEEIDRISDRMMKRIDTFNTSREPGERTVQFGEIFYEDLSGDQRDILNTMIAEEKDVSYRSLLTRILEDRDAIKTLQDRVMRLEQTLPDRFVVARKGDSHRELAMSYLVNEAKVDEKKAKQLLAEVDQSDELVAGNKVWFFYDSERDAFRTYITQGEAGQTPLAVRRAVKRQLITERDAAVTRADAAEASLRETKASLESQIFALSGDLATLTERRRELEADVSSLQASKADLETNVALLSEDLAFRQNSLYYHAESEADLKERGVLSSVLKRVQDVKGVSFDQALDLRASSTITLAPAEFGLERIKEVKLLPAIYQAGRDFQVETSEDGGSARLRILDPDLFRGREVLLAVRG